MSPTMQSYTDYPAAYDAALELARLTNDHVHGESTGEKQYDHGYVSNSGQSECRDEHCFECNAGGRVALKTGREGLRR
jgi:hypothetical protein